MPIELDAYPWFSSLTTDLDSRIRSRILEPISGSDVVRENMDVVNDLHRFNLAVETIAELRTKYIPR